MMKFKKILSIIFASIILLTCSINITFAKTSHNFDNGYFITNKITKSKNFLITIDGNFINTNKNRIYNFKNVTILLKQKNGKLLKRSVFNDSKLKSISLSPGNFINWKFSIIDKKLFKSLNVKDTLVYCTFSDLTEFDNSAKNCAHIFLNNTEVTQKNIPFISKNNTILIPLSILKNIETALNIKKCNGNSIKSFNYTLLKQYPKLKSALIYSKNIPYLSLNSLKNLLKPKNKIYYNTKTIKKNFIYIVLYKQ